MIEKLMSLAERLVVALELIASLLAKAAERELNPCAGQEAPGDVAGSTPGTPGDVAGSTPVPDKYDAMDYGILKTLCGTRGIKVPERTRTETLKKWLREYDETHDRIVDGVIVEGRKPSTSAQPDPFAAETSSPTAAEVDPFAEPVSAKVYTLEEVRGELQKLMAKESRDAVVEVLQTHGGSQMLKNVPPEKFPAIMKALEGRV